MIMYLRSTRYLWERIKFRQPRDLNQREAFNGRKTWESKGEPRYLLEVPRTGEKGGSQDRDHEDEVYISSAPL